MSGEQPAASNQPPAEIISQELLVLTDGNHLRIITSWLAAGGSPLAAP